MTHSSNTYDRVPYDSYPYAQSHPRHLASIGRLKGLKTRDLSRARILELGCSSGGNLLPLAEQMPGCVCIGIDGSSTQIELGLQTLRESGLEGVTLRHEDIRSFNCNVEPFDFILVHGVYSWVPHDVQEKIFEICDRTLASDGIAYISYNTYPGWRLRGMIRDLMMYRASFFDTPETKLREGLALIDFLAKAVPTENNAYGMLLTSELESLRPKADSYLIHEHLEENNRPEYFHEFIQRAERHGLQYLAEADYSTMAASNFPAEIERTLRNLSADSSAAGADVIQMEQYMDFVRNRMFRQTLLCRKSAAIDHNPPAERVFDLFVRTNAEPENPPVHPLQPGRVTFRRRNSTLTTSEPLVKAAMLVLREEWPRLVPFRELLAAARARLQPGARLVDAAVATEEARSLARVLLQCFSTDHIDFSASPLPFSLDIEPTPSATRLARHQARSGGPVTNLVHEMVRLNDVERKVLSWLDGAHDRDRLVGRLSEEVTAGRLVVQDGGRQVEERARIVGILEELLDDTLKSIARKGLLIRPSQPGMRPH